MQSTFIVRLIDLTLLLLLSLLALVRISNYEVELPISQDLRDEGSLVAPIQTFVSVQGELFVEGIGRMSAEGLSDFSALEERAVELRVDANADVFHLMQIHQTLDQAGRPSVFMVEHQGH